MARLLSRALRSVASNSSSFNQPRHIPFSASASSSLIQAKIHKRSLLFPSTSSPSSLGYPNFSSIRLFSSEAQPTTKLDDDVSGEPDRKAVTLTSIIDEHVEAGRTKEALQVYRKFIAAGISPDRHTYESLIEALAADPNYVGAAKDCVLHMMTNGLCDHPNVSAYMAVYEAFVKQGKPDEGNKFLMEIKAKGLCGVDEESVRERLKGKSELAAGVQTVVDILMSDKYGESTHPFESLCKNYAIMDFHFKKYKDEELVNNDHFFESFKKASTFALGCECYKMFEALIQDGLTKEAIEIRASILDTGKIPGVVFFTGWIDASNLAGDTKQAIEVFRQMVSSGVPPNAYTYAVLIKALTKDANFLGDAKKYLLEMVEQGMRPNAKTYNCVVEAFARSEKMEECWELMKQMKAKGIVLD